MPDLEHIRIENPLPARYVTTEPGVGGCIKVRPEDFVVEEIPLYEPIDEGHHLYLRVRKVGVSHGELMSCVRRTFDVPESAIGYAGMKDKHAVTTQTISVQLARDPPSVEIDHDRIAVLWAARHRNKLKRGHLRGNRFSIRIRALDPLRVPAVGRILKRLERVGVPAYFGSQRFGYRRNNHRLGAMILNGAWTDVLAELLGARGSAFPEYQRERREQFDAGRIAEAAPAWGPADRSELIAIKRLVRGGDARDAVRAIGATTLNFWTSSLSSACFNRMLDARLADGRIATLEQGDVAWKHENRVTFPVTADDIAAGALPPRLERLEISPTGPLWGRNMPRASGPVAARETAALEEIDMSEARFTGSRFSPVGGRRPFSAPIRNIDVEGGFDEHGPMIRVAFDLPRGMYATVVMREIMKVETP